MLVMQPRSPAVAEPPLAYDLPPLPAGLDSLAPLADVASRIERCAGECGTAVYLWTPRMPLSRAGIPHVARAADRLGLSLALVAYEELHAYAVTGDGAAGPGASHVSAPAANPVADALLATGALAHAPALVLFSGGEPAGSAILGYKSEAAYEALLARRAWGTDAHSSPPVSMASPRPLADVAADRPDAATWPAPDLADYEAVGAPGAYFRWVPGRNAVAYESSQRIYVLDLASGQSRPAPGYIDFVPTPDGRYFVTPAAGDGGLEFYDAAEVFEAVQSGRIGAVEPIFTDLRMRDQYPSVGILERGAARTLYRVLTSWFDTVVYRDYDVRVDQRTGLSSVQPVGEPVRPCAGMTLSTPIMSQDGLEVAARDEAIGTTKIFRIQEGGSCAIVTDLGVSTSKVAWHSTGRVLAFSIPRRSRGTDQAELGIFVLDRDSRRLTRLSGSEVASRLAFPDFIGADSVVFLVPGASARESSLFRVVAVPR
jgi:hypothetical protein